MNIYGATERTSGLQTPRLTLDDGRTHRGVWLSLRDPAVVDILAAESFDWVCIDGQHGAPETSELQYLIEAAHLFSVPSLVRVPGHEIGTIGRALDAGAGGIVFPTVENAATAAALVAACRFPPRGRRSYGPTRRSPRYSAPVPGNPHDDALCVLMVETVAGLNNLEKILAVGPDAVFVGPYDLSLNLGMTLEELTGQGPDGILADVARRCTAAGVVPGIYAGEPGLSKTMAGLGFQFFPIASDTGLLAVAARDALSASRQLAETP